MLVKEGKAVPFSLCGTQNVLMGILLRESNCVILKHLDRRCAHYMPVISCGNLRISLAVLNGHLELVEHIVDRHNVVIFFKLIVNLETGRAA